MRARSKASELPAYEAQLATLVDRPPEGTERLHEQKFDGYRIALHIDGGTIEPWSRRGEGMDQGVPDSRGSRPIAPRAQRALGLSSAAWSWS
jgi:bifunctional non-homologous end joining protein LigD